MEARVAGDLSVCVKVAAQEVGVWCVMGAHNQFRGQHYCENNYLLNKILKGEWGFKGLVMSDWSGMHDTRECALNGFDLEMGANRKYDNFYLVQPYLFESAEVRRTADGRLDNKVGANSGAGYYVYTFAPHQKTAKLPTEGSLNVGLMGFLRLLDGCPHFNIDMYLDIVETGFEIMHERDWVTAAGSVAKLTKQYQRKLCEAP